MLNVLVAVCGFIIYRFCKKIYEFEDSLYQVFWNWLWTIVYSIVVIKLNGLAGKVTRSVVANENFKYEADHENSLIRYSYLLAFVNCYIGLFAAMFAGSIVTLNFLLFTILIFK